MNKKTEPFLIRILYYPLVILQFLLMTIGWYSLLSIVEYRFAIVINNSLWLLVGMFFALLSICFPFYLKLTDIESNRIWQTYNGKVNKPKEKDSNKE